jgi:hypothetical protein
VLFSVLTGSGRTTLENILFSLFAGASLLLIAAPATHAQSAQPNGCVLISAMAPDQPKPIKVQKYQDLIMLAEITEACPLTSYHPWQTLVWGEYDPSMLDYVRLETHIVKTPQLTEEMMVLMPVRAGGDWSDIHGTFDIDMASAATNVQSTLITAPPDKSPPYGRWTGGLTKAETAAIFASDPSAFQTKVLAADTCGTPEQTGTRFVLVTDTCTEATYPRVADPGVPNYSVGGTQFADTATNLWLLKATYTRDDGNGEVLMLVSVGAPDSQIQAGADPAGGVGGPPGGRLPMTAIQQSSLAKISYPQAPLDPTHEYYLTWLAGGNP